MMAMRDADNNSFPYFNDYFYVATNYLSSFYAARLVIFISNITIQTFFIWQLWWVACEWSDCWCNPVMVDGRGEHGLVGVMTGWWDWHGDSSLTIIRFSFVRPFVGTCSHTDDWQFNIFHSPGANGRAEMSRQTKGWLAIILHSKGRRMSGWTLRVHKVKWII